MSAESSARPSTAARRRVREQKILAATRDLFDHRGVKETQIEDIARSAGVNRAIIYRHFSGKDEILALALVGYLDELADALESAAAPHDDPADRLTAIIEAFVDYGIAYPAFVDCAQELMRRSGPALLDELTDSALLRLGRGIATCLAVLTTTLDDGQRSGAFVETDSVVLANHMYASGLGALQLARLGMLIREPKPGVPAMVPLPNEQVKKYLAATARALAAK
ncbi:MAG: TetR/AcrR family transcriptional regulator [Marmoricola sp.]